mmetsp:Transcript_73587/g.85489  ORF Transcript_73587/g.85489 Transcript_73587/m.85489 type:complete len:106 (+) Transcript_73587:3-320(+)
MACSLCGQTGATVQCYHPECREAYHVLCAIFSNGYVNFGQRDPFLPCPACPKHTHVKCPDIDAIVEPSGQLTSSRKRPRSVDGSSVSFDSSIVESGDLRDPDDEG